MRDDDIPARNLYSFPGYFLELENKRLEEEAKVEREKKRKARKEKKAKKAENPKRKEYQYKKIETTQEKIRKRMEEDGVITRNKLVRKMTMEFESNLITSEPELNLDDLPQPSEIEIERKEVPPIQEQDIQAGGKWSTVKGHL